MIKLELKSTELKQIYEQKEIPYFKTFIAGKWVEGEEFIDIKSPIDLETFAKIPKLKNKEIHEAISLLYEQGRWDIRDTPGEKRLNIFHRAADLMSEFIEDFVEVLILNNGKTKSAARGEVNACIERLRRADMDLRRMYGEYVPGDWSSESLESEAIIRREPYGLVLAITPFNYPLFDAVHKLVYSTVSGNSILLKPSILTPLPSILLARILQLAGFPEKALAVLPISGSETEKILSDRRISVITFTGSSETGERVIKNSGIKSFLMELGGGDPAIVLRDAEIKYAASRVAIGITSYSGQRCDAIKLILAEKEIYEELKNSLIDELKKLRVGDPRDPETNIGPLIEEKTAIEYEESIKDALNKGAKLIFGGKRIKSNYVEPALIEADPSLIKDLYLYNKEVFAPISLITSFEDLDSAIELANGRRYGLDAAIFGKDIDKIRKLIRMLEVGTIYVNDYPRHGIGYFPFGGRKDSGIGREGIGYAIEYVMTYKTIVYSYKGKGIWEYL